jgi:putative transposase
MQAPGAVYHVTTRGVRQLEIYTDVRDRLRFLQLLGQIVQLREWRCHTYCLMTNHYHLLIETPHGDISLGMQRLNGMYAQWFNWRHGHEGHLFDRRFGAVLVEGYAHLLELARYIVLNPVRAGLCRHAAEWRWSSYPAMVGSCDRPAFLTTAWILSLFSDHGRRAQELYAEFVAAGAEAGVRSRRVLGSGTGTRPS